MKSEIRFAGTPDEAYELVVFVFSKCWRWADRLEAALPDALRIIRVADPASLRLDLAGQCIPCGVLVDVDLPRADRVRLFDELGVRWARPPTLPLIRRVSPEALEEARFHTSNRPFFEGSAESDETLEIFYRSALGSILYWIAARLMVARDHHLDESSMELFVGIAIHQLSRSELPRYLCLSDAAVQKRIRKLGAALRVGSHFSQIIRLLNAVNITRCTPRAPELLKRLESGSAQLHSATRAQLGG